MLFLHLKHLFTFFSPDFLSSGIQHFFNSVTNVAGTLTAVALATGALFLMVKDMFKSNEGVNFVKNISIIALIPIISAIIGSVINKTNFYEYLVIFFALIRKLLMTWNFWLNIPLLLHFLSLSLSIFVAYWLFRGLLFVLAFFRARTKIINKVTSSPAPAVISKTSSDSSSN